MSVFKPITSAWNQVNSPEKLKGFVMGHIPHIAGVVGSAGLATYLGNKEFNEKAREIAEHPEWYYDDYGYDDGLDNGIMNANANANGMMNGNVMMKGASLIERRMCGLYAEFLNGGR